MNECACECECVVVGGDKKEEEECAGRTEREEMEIKVES